MYIQQLLKFINATRTQLACLQANYWYNGICCHHKPPFLHFSDNKLKFELLSLPRDICELKRNDKEIVQ